MEYIQLSTDYFNIKFDIQSDYNYIIAREETLAIISIDNDGGYHEIVYDNWKIKTSKVIIINSSVIPDSCKTNMETVRKFIMTLINFNSKSPTR